MASYWPIIKRKRPLKRKKKRLRRSYTIEIHVACTYDTFPCHMKVSWWYTKLGEVLHNEYGEWKAEMVNTFQKFNYLSHTSYFISNQYNYSGNYRNSRPPIGWEWRHIINSAEVIKARGRIFLKCPYRHNFYFLIWFYVSPNELLRKKNLIWIKCNLF